MKQFKATVVDEIALHTGDPHCDAAHAALLGMLQYLGTPFIGSSETISKSQKGNLGEFITYQIAQTRFPLPSHKRFSGNALNPLSKISNSGLDLVYVYLDQINPANDILYIQEVKTTGQQNLSYFDQLKSDYAKLFEPDPQFSLATRIQGIQNILEFNHGDLAGSTRVGALFATTPAQCSKVHLLPTGISTAGSGDPKAKLTAIRSSICAWGWADTQVKPWSIVMSDLDSRLLRMAQGSL